MNSFAATASSPSSSTSTATILFSLFRFSSSPSKFHKHPRSPPSSSPSLRVVCGGPPPHHPPSQAQPTSPNHNFILHEALDSLGIDTTHARDARRGFVSQIERLTNIERETSVCINRRVDLAKTALFIAAEDDSLVSHSSVPLPVEAFIDRLDDLSMGFCTSNSNALRASPEILLDSLDKYLFLKKGFRRSSVSNQSEPRALYLHSVLTHRAGSAAMLTVIYSEILKMLRLWSLLDFDCEIFFPHNLHGVPRGYPKQKSKESDHPHIMTSQALLEEILRNLKEVFWPFQHDQSKSLFLRAADAANCIDRLNTVEESFQLASAKAAQHRLDRGVWTSVRFGDMRRALSACEHLILLKSNPEELRDYSVLLYHCGFYEVALQYIKLYQDTKGSSLEKSSSSKFSNLEEVTLEKLVTRLNLILMEDGWSNPSNGRNFLGNTSEPW